MVTGYNVLMAVVIVVGVALIVGVFLVSTICADSLEEVVKNIGNAAANYINARAERLRERKP